MTEALDRVKGEMEERGRNMIDAGPLVRIKQAITRLKTECTQMDVRIGVVRLFIESSALYLGGMQGIRYWS